MYTIQRASELERNSRVVREDDMLPHLVNRVEVLPNGAVEVAYSSGDTVVYAAAHPLVTIESE